MIHTRKGSFGSSFAIFRDLYKAYYERKTTLILVYKGGFTMTIIVDKEGWVVKIVK